eukprot:11117739-Alexandrium_andersonii.AAC.1
MRRVGSLPLPAKLRRLASATGPLSAATWARIVRPFSRWGARALQASCRRGVQSSQLPSAGRWLL